MKPIAVVFDLFGTLLEIASLREAAAAVTPQPDAFVATWREKQLGYAFAATIMEMHEDFDVMTDYALAYAAAKHGIALDAAARQSLVDAWQRVRAYDDVGPVLLDLQAREVRCAVLTNGTPATSAAALANAGIAQHIDVTLSVESAGAFKPDRRVYELVTKHYGAPAGRFVFVTSNGWDATGAAAFGMRVAWCNRNGMPTETFGPPPAWTLRDLSELKAIVDAS
jgi:2-haloacid dehalogenase